MCASMYFCLAYYAQLVTYYYTPYIKAFDIMISCLPYNAFISKLTNY